MKIKLNIFVLFFVIARVQAQPNDSFKELFDRARKLETLKDVIKDKNYYEQRACFMRGNCEHPMDTLAQSLNNTQLTVTKFVKTIHEEQEKGTVERVKKELNISDEKWADIQSAGDEYKKLMQTKPVGKIEYEAEIDKKLSPRIKETIQELYKVYDLKGGLEVAYEPYHGAIIRTRWVGKKALFLKKKLVVNVHFFALNEDAQEASVEHECIHMKNEDAPIDFIRKAFGIESLKLYHRNEYIADQVPASKNVRTARLMEIDRFIILIQGKRQNDTGESHTHPSHLNRYQAVKTIRQMHEAVDRKAYGKQHPKYTQKSYEKYVVGDERAWDRWCEKEKMVIKKALNSIDLFGKKRRKA